VDAVQERPNGILVLMPRTDAEGARRAMEQISSRIMSVLKIDPGFQYTLVDDSTARSIHDRAA
jgi:hypothetical protein